MSEIVLGRRWRDAALLDRALTHPSLSNETGVASNQVMEFLGDSVLDLLVASWLITLRPDWAEGRLSMARSQLVRTETLATAGRKAGLGALIRLGRGGVRDRIYEHPSVLADAVEAVVGAAYLDGGLDAATDVARHFRLLPTDSELPA